MNLREIEALTSLAVNAVMQSPDDPAALVSQNVLLDLATIGLVTDQGVPTEKGQAYIAALEAVPLPVQRWVIPEVPHAVEKRVEPRGGVVEHQDGDGGGQAAEAGHRDRAQRSRKKQSASAKE